MDKTYLTSTIIPLWLSGVMIEHDKFIFFALFLVIACILLYKAGVTEPDDI